MAALFKNFAEVCEWVAATPRKNEKVDKVAAYLHELPAQEAGLAARYLGGNAFAAWEERTLQVGGNLLWRVLAEVSGDEGQLTEAFRKYRDLGLAAEEVFARRNENGGVLSLRQLADAFDSLAESAWTSSEDRTAQNPPRAILRSGSKIHCQNHSWRNANGAEGEPR